MLDERSVLVIGSAGTGKSSIGNEALGLDPARDSKEELQPEKGWCTSPDPRSCSDRVLTKGPHLVQYDTDNGVRGYQMTWTDTPGVPDTEGRGTVFLDKIVEEMRRLKPHVVVYVVNANGKFDHGTELSLLALRECLNNMLSDCRLVVFVNKLPTDFSCRGREGTPDAIRKGIAEKWHQNVVGKLLPEGGVTVPLVMNQDQSFDGVAKLLELIHEAPDTPMDVREFRTWSEVVEREKMLREKENAKKVAEDKVRNLEAEIAEMKNNIRWHEKFVEDLKKCVSCLRWVPSVGMVADGLVGITEGILQKRAASLRVALRNKEDEKNMVKADAEKYMELEQSRCRSLMVEIDRLHKLVDKVTEEP